MDTISNFLYYIVIYNIPLLYGTVGEIVTEKSGSLNLGVEGTMAVGAIFGYLAGYYTDNIFIGILVSVIAAGLCGLLFAFLTVSLRANQNVTGLTISTFGVGLYFFIGRGLGDKWPHLISSENVKAAFSYSLDIPVLSDLPIIGKMLFSHNIMVYLGIIIAILVWIYLKYTKVGLKLRAVGENPAAADSIGININMYKYINIILGAGIMGIGGYYMGLNLGGSFEGSNCWINGYGWISVALVIFANWNAMKAILGTFVFGFFSTLQVYSSSIANSFPKAFGWLGEIPPQLYQALPFAITAIVLVISSIRKNKNSQQPAAIGQNYFREDR